jgi:solute carrier family 25 (mitochondrial S-adenosylmethionine transporter), member 26
MFPYVSNYQRKSRLVNLLCRAESWSWRLHWCTRGERTKELNSLIFNLFTVAFLFLDNPNFISEIGFQSQTFFLLLLLLENLSGSMAGTEPVYLLLPPKSKSDFASNFSHLTSLLLSPVSPSKNPNPTSFSPFDRATIGAAAGAAAGAFTYVALLPLDAVKTNLQTKLYSNSVEATISIFKTKGIQGFYRGLSAVVIGSATSSAVYFGTCELAKHIMYACGAGSGRFTVPRVVVPPLAGAMGNVVSSAIMVPKELITQRMQAGASGRSWQVLLRILKNDGILGLYAGYTATLLRNLPAGILSYSSFEYLKAFVLFQTKQNQLKPAQSILCGALAGSISASLTTPLDVVKTRLMTQTHKNAQRKVSEILRQIVNEEGWGGLARGIGPRVLHSACFAALGYFAFETVRVEISKRYTEQKKKAVAES